MSMPPGYDAWKTGGADPYYISAADEAALEQALEDTRQCLLEAILATVDKERCGLPLIDILTVLETAREEVKKEDAIVARVRS